MQHGLLMAGVIVAVAIVSRPADADEWQTKLESVIRQCDSNALVTVENGAYVYRYHTQTFKIHTVHKTGAISETAHDEEGPNVDGILMKVTLQDGPYQGAADIPQDLKTPYWTTFINAYPVATGKHLWLGLSYGIRADKKLMEAIKTCFGPILPSEPGTINRTYERAQPPAGGGGKAAPQP